MRPLHSSLHDAGDRKLMHRKPGARLTSLAPPARPDSRLLNLPTPAERFQAEPCPRMRSHCTNRVLSSRLAVEALWTNICSVHLQRFYQQHNRYHLPLQIDRGHHRKYFERLLLGRLEGPSLKE